MTSSCANVEDLGSPARGDQWMDWRVARLPAGGQGYVGVLSRGGLMFLDLRGGSARQIGPDPPLDCGWSFCQTPDGTCWHADMGSRQGADLYRCDADGDRSQRVLRLPVRHVMALAATSDGAIWFGPATRSELWRLEPGSLKSELAARWSDAGGARRILAGRDGWLYLLTDRQDHQRVLAVSPAGQVQVVLDIRPWQAVLWHDTLLQDAAGDVFVQCIDQPEVRRWWRLHEGEARPLSQRPPSLVKVDLWPGVGLAATGCTVARLDDGSSLRAVHDREVWWRDAAGRDHHLLLRRRDLPLRLFSVAVSGRTVWGGTFIPLTLFGYEIDSGQARTLGNPTRSSSGEIYRIVPAGGDLYLGGYANASITRYRPGDRLEEPRWNPGSAPDCNPRELGLVGEEPWLHRPRAATVDALGRIYFGAWDSKGRGRHSAIACLTPGREGIERWPLPGIELCCLACLSGGDDLLACWRDEADAHLVAAVLNFDRRAVLRQCRLARDRGSIIAALALPDGDFVLLHDYRAALLKLNVASMTVVAQRAELNLGDHVQESLAWDEASGRVLGLTSRCIFAITADLQRPSVVAEYPDHAGGNFYRFGLSRGPGRTWYFANGSQLMRLSLPGSFRAPA
jgi:hypothetical protein